MASTRTAERGFTLLELLVCMAIMALASAAVLGAFAALARNATPGAARDLALMVAENALVRARAATAYASSPSQDGTALITDRSWALVPGTTRYTATLQLRPGACGDTRVPMLRLPVAATYDPNGERFSVAVRYPADPCRPDDALSVTLFETLPPSVYPPGQVIHHDIATPARM